MHIPSKRESHIPNEVQHENSLKESKSSEKISATGFADEDRSDLKIQSADKTEELVVNLQVNEVNVIHEDPPVALETSADKDDEAWYKVTKKRKRRNKRKDVALKKHNTLEGTECFQPKASNTTGSQLKMNQTVQKKMRVQQRRRKRAIKMI